LIDNPAGAGDVDRAGREQSLLDGWMEPTSLSSSALLCVRLRNIPVGVMYPTVEMAAFRR
jgi:hypothetical protein